MSTNRFPLDGNSFGTTIFPWTGHCFGNIINWPRASPFISAMSFYWTSSRVPISLFIINTIDLTIH